LAFNHHLLWWVGEEETDDGSRLKNAAAIAESSYPADHPMVGLTLGYSAFDAERGEDWLIFERALKILEGSYGPDHWRVGQLLTNMSFHIWELGDLERARELMDRSVAIGEESEVRGLLGARLEARTCLYEEMGLIDLEEAILAGERALGVAREERSRSFFLAGMLEEQADRLMRSGRLLEANAMQGEALGAREAYASPGHLHFGDTLWRLAEIRARLGDFDSARALNRRALSIHETFFGSDDSFEVQRNLHLETRLLWAMGQLEGAGDTALRLEAARRRLVRSALSGLPERQSLSLTARQLTGRDFLLSAAIVDPGSSRALKAADAVIRARGMVLDSLAQRNTITKVQRDAETIRLDRAVTRARDNLARLVVSGEGRGDADDLGARIRQATREKDRAELDLAARSGRFRRQHEAQSIGLPETRAALPERSGLVSYVRFDSYEPVERDKSIGWPLKPTPGYLAIVLRADREQPVLLSLGPAPAIDRQIGALRQQVWELAAAADRAPELSLAQYDRMGSSLREAIWDPVAPALAGLERVFLVPDGQLHLVHWGALPVRQGGYLIEQPARLHYLSAERDLVGLPRRSESAGTLLAMGDPAFAETDLYAALASADSEVFQLARLDLEAEGPVFRGRRASCGGFADLQFEELPASLAELRSIEAAWRSSEAFSVPVVLRRAAANEAAFKTRAPGSQVVHLATHGFYLGGNCGAGGEGSPGGHAIENPLLLSGLALAGANHRQAAGPEEEDGVLTAEEIAALDLQGVDWAVLSGCETGVGETRAGEGVFGLRRAFQMAGAQTLIMSLWPVDDEATRDWMTALYRHRFIEGLATIAAVRQASLDLLAARRAAGLSTHPFYWAGFVAAGDWR
jgi:CHAT domain-containing protein/tetratricopeptide (TPR) repeat protein